MSESKKRRIREFEMDDGRVIGVDVDSDDVVYENAPPVERMEDEQESEGAETNDDENEQTSGEDDGENEWGTGNW